MTLHSHGLYHRDVGLDVVFVDDDLDVEGAVLAGFSEMADTGSAEHDYYQVFQTLRQFLGAADVPSSWLGNAHLDQLWMSFSLSYEQWTQEAQALRPQDINLCDSDELWYTLTLETDIDIRFQSRGQTTMLDCNDVRAYVRVSSISSSSRTATIYDIRRLYKKSGRALSHGERSGYISVAEYHLFANHIKYRHRSSIGWSLAIELPDSFIKSDDTALRLALQFKVPCHRRYELVSFSHLIHAKPSMAGDFIALVKHEVRGPKELPGLYISFSDFSHLAQDHGLAYDAGLVCSNSSCDLQEFSYPEFYLIAANESS